MTTSTARRPGDAHPSAPAAACWAKCPRAVILDGALSPAAVRLYLYLDMRAGKRGWFWATQQEIGDALGCSVATVRRLTAELRDGGYAWTERCIDHRTALHYHLATRSPRPDGADEPESEPAPDASPAPLTGERSGSADRAPAAPARTRPSASDRASTPRRRERSSYARDPLSEEPQLTPQTPPPPRRHARASGGGGRAIRVAECARHGMSGAESLYLPGQHYHPLPDGSRCVFVPTGNRKQRAMVEGFFE